MAHIPDIAPETAVALAPVRLEGVRTARVIGFVVDYLAIGVLTALASLLLVVLTIGLGFGLLPLVFPVVALVYLAPTLGGEAQATPGMRIAGVRMFKVDGGRVDPFLAMLHGLLFWFLGWWTLPTTFFSSRKRLLHDIALGTWVGRP